MILPRLGFLKRQSDQVVVIELDEAITKGVLLGWSNHEFRLLNYVFFPTPTFQGGSSTKVLADHLREVTKTLGSGIKHIILSISGGDSLLRYIELPTVPIGDMRKILRMNSVAYLKQDLSDYVFDCFALPNSCTEKE